MKRFVSVLLTIILLLGFAPRSFALAPEPPVPTFERVASVVLVTLSAPEGYDLSGQSFYYRVDDGVWMQYAYPVGVPFGSTFYAKTVRAVGDESPVITVAFDEKGESTVQAGEALPSVTPTDVFTGPLQIIANTGAWTRDPVTVTISPSDVPCEYRVGADGEWHDYSGAFSVSSPVTVYARRTGLFADSQIEPLDIFNIDVVPPVITDVKFSATCKTEPVAIDSGSFPLYYREPVSMSIDGAADMESGLSFYEYQLVGNTESLSDSRWQRYDPAAPPSVTSDFCGYVYTRAFDAVGNNSAAVASQGFVVDRTAPVISNIKLSTTELTDSRVTVTFSVTDNFLLDSVSVNDSYVGIYDSSFTAFRNGDYVISARDKAGNIRTNTVSVTNINSTPFNLLNMFRSLEEHNFTPSSWSVAQSAATELQSMLTVESSEAMLSAASEKLLASMESLVLRGDGTASKRLIERVNEYDPEQYTTSSWARVTGAIETINQCLDDPECTQERIDTSRQSLELAVTDLAVRGSFTSLDRLISQADALDPTRYSEDKFALFSQALDAARNLDRADSSQADVDNAYNVLLSCMNGLKELPVEEKHEFPTVAFVIIGMLIIAAGSLLFIFNRRMKSYTADNNEDEEGSDDNDADIDDTADTQHPSAYGDIYFTDDSNE